MKKRIIVTATKDMPVDIKSLSAALNMPHEIEVVPLLFGEMSLAERESYWERISSADALLLRTGIITYELVGRCRSLKIIAVHGEGLHQVALKAATEAGIYVTNVPDGNVQAAAEYTIALMLSALRHIPIAHQYMKQGIWDMARFAGSELSGKRLGLLGLGEVGQRVAKIAHAFGAEVVYWDADEIKTDIASFCNKEKLFATSDIVSIHLSLNPSTHGLVDRKLLALMKKESWLINTARGQIVAQQDLIQALEEKWFAGAALDVFEQEPLPSESPLHQLDNVILTPHLAGLSQEGLKRMAQMAAMDINAALSGLRPRNAVNQPWIVN